MKVSLLNFGLSFDIQKRRREEGRCKMLSNLIKEHQGKQEQLRLENGNTPT